MNSQTITLVPSVPTLNPSLFNQVNGIHKEAIAKLMTYFGHKAVSTFPDTLFNPIAFVFNKRLQTTGGRATSTFKTGNALIELNYRLFTSTGSFQDLKDTYIHELGHILANRVYLSSCGHNTKWQRIVELLGGDSSRTHRMDVNHLRPYHTRRNYNAYCDCHIHHITKNKWNAINVKGSGWICTKCNSALSVIQNEEVINGK